MYSTIGLEATSDQERASDAKVKSIAVTENRDRKLRVGRRGIEPALEEVAQRDDIYPYEGEQRKDIET
jgi:hypothetical protein